MPRRACSTTFVADRPHPSCEEATLPSLGRLARVEPYSGCTLQGLTDRQRRQVTGHTRVAPVATLLLPELLEGSGSSAPATITFATIGQLTSCHRGFARLSR